jgi:hypothetical protein
MVQIIPAAHKKKETDWAALLMGAGQVAQGAYDKYKQKEANKETRDWYKKTTGTEMPKTNDPKVQQLYIADALKGERKKQEINALAGLIKPDESSGNYQEEAQEENPYMAGLSEYQLKNDQREEPRKKVLSSTKDDGLSQEERKAISISDEAITRAATINPSVAAQWRAAKDSALSKQLQYKKFEYKQESDLTKALAIKQADIRKETLPFRQNLAERAEAAERDLTAKKESLELINSGKIDHPLVATFLENLPGKMGMSFLSPETVQYKASLVQGYGALKNLFAGATRVKEIEILEAKIADTYLTDEQKIAVINSMSRASQQDIIMADAAQEIEEESEAEGKPLGILEFRKKLNERAKQKSDALFNRVLDEQDAIFKDAENIKKMPLDFNNPEHKSIISQIMQEAKKATKDPKKIAQEAEKIAKKKGYHW